MLAPNELKHIGPFVVGQIVAYVQREQEQLEVMEQKRQWHVLLIEPQHETRSQSYLTAHRFKIYVPRIPRLTTRGVRRTKVQVEWPMFPGYAFIRFDPDLDDSRRFRIDMAPGVREFMKLDGAHAILSDKIMADVYQVEQQEHDKVARRGAAHSYEVGEMVRVSGGVFTGFNADVVRLDDNDRITVLLSLLGRATKVTLQVDDLEKL